MAPASRPCRSAPTPGKTRIALARFPVPSPNDSYPFAIGGHWGVQRKFACPHSSVGASGRTADKGMGTKEFRPLLQARPLSPNPLTSGRRRAGHFTPGTPVRAGCRVPMCRLALRNGITAAGRRLPWLLDFLTGQEFPAIRTGGQRCRTLAAEPPAASGGLPAGPLCKWRTVSSK